MFYKKGSSIFVYTLCAVYNSFNCDVSVFPKIFPFKKNVFVYICDVIKPSWFQYEN